jgi:methionyl-tRNA formyltransferase
VRIATDDTTTIVEAKLAIRGAELLIETLDAIEAGAARETPQDESLVSYAPKLAKGEGLVKWALPASQIHNLVRGLWPWPHAYTYLGNTRYILHRSRLSARPTLNEAPGTIVHASPIDGLHVVCGDRTTLELVDIQLEGKRVMGARELMAAQTLVAGAQFTQP